MTNSYNDAQYYVNNVTSMNSPHRCKAHAPDEWCIERLKIISTEMCDREKKLAQDMLTKQMNDEIEKVKAKYSEALAILK